MCLGGYSLLKKYFRIDGTESFVRLRRLGKFAQLILNVQAHVERLEEKGLEADQS